MKILALAVPAMAATTLALSGCKSPVMPDSARSAESPKAGAVHEKPVVLVREVYFWP